MKKPRTTYNSIYLITNNRLKLLNYKKQGIKGFIKYILDYWRQKMNKEKIKKIYKKKKKKDILIFIN